MSLAFALLAVLVLQPQPRPLEEPRAVVRAAMRAVEGDSVPALRARWAARAAQRPADDAAVLGLATLHRLTYDYAGSLRWAARLQSRAEADPLAAAWWMNRAETLLATGALRDAESDFANAARVANAVGAAALAAEAWLGVAEVRSRAADHEAALAAIERADRGAPRGDGGLEAHLRCQRALVLARRGDGAAIALAAAGAERARRSGQPRVEALCLHAQARAHAEHGEVARAGASLIAAADLQGRAKDRAGLAHTKLLGATLLVSVGSYALARDYLDEATAAAHAAGDRYALAGARLYDARLALAMGDLHRARANAREALELAEAMQRQPLLADVRTGLAELALAERNLPDAARWLEAAGTHARSDRATPRERYRHHRLDAQVAVHAGDLDAALTHLHVAGLVAQDHGLTGYVDGIHFFLAELHFMRGEWSDARASLKVLAAHPQQPVRIYQSRALSAALHAQEGALEEAEALLVGASDKLDQWRATLADSLLRLQAYQAIGAFGHAEFGVAYTIARLAQGGRPAGAFRLAERRRARELHGRLAHPRHGADEHARALDLLTTAAEVQHALPDDRTALLEYVTGRGGQPTTLLVLLRDSLHAYVLPPIDSLEADVRRFVAQVEGGADPRALGQRLGQAVLWPALADLPPRVERLVLVPEDVLHHVPFDALVLPDSRFALERFAIATAPSAALAMQLWKRSGPPREPRLLAFGDPAFVGETTPLDPRAEVFRSAFREDGGLPRLPASAREARRIARYAARAEVRLRGRASARFLRETPLHEYRVLHFATHARVDNADHERTALVLAAADGDDGFLSPSELASLRLDADLVVLSACRSGGGVIVGGEGVQGLTAPLLAGGARAVVATAWPIGDRRTIHLVEDFYRGMADGLPVGDALHMAKLAALRRGAPAAEWAAFTLVGDPLVRVPLRRPGPPVAARLAIMIAAVALLGLGGLRVRRRRQRPESHARRPDR